jgi:hypothetical protein
LEIMMFLHRLRSNNAVGLWFQRRKFPSQQVSEKRPTLFR